MKSAKIFLVGNTDNQLIEMTETPFEKEDILQVLLERYHDLLPGDQINPESPRRWLLVSREMGIPGKEQGGNVWSLDHLFLDQSGIPTFVECKRASDTRSRREVVAQMLDYAANGTMYWSINSIRQSASEFANKKGRNLDDDVKALIAIDEPVDVETFWQTVEENLRKGRVRLIFVSDHTPQELRRLVEFLNEKMNDVEVLAVEIKQFIGLSDHKAVVPRVVGQTETAREVKSSGGGPSQHITRDQFIANVDPETVEVFTYILDRAEELKHHIYWGTVGLSVGYVLPENMGRVSFIYCYPPTRFEFYFAALNLEESEEMMLRKELLDQGIFRESGKRTLRADITPKNVLQVRQTADLIFTRMKEIMEKRYYPPNP